MSRVLAMPMMSSVRGQPIADKAAVASRRYLRQVFSLLAVVMLVALLFVWTRIQVIQLGYEVSRIRSEVTELGRQRDMLQAEIGELRAPDRLSRIASERFGMRLPMGDEVVLLRRAGGTGDADRRGDDAEVSKR
ncbi:MAG: cell division protein FtsL [Proteobacteria bacterium]|nr:cell division protein FtsL [Pseudomonadota bacterium]